MSARGRAAATAARVATGSPLVPCHPQQPATHTNRSPPTPGPARAHTPENKRPAVHSPAHTTPPHPPPPRSDWALDPLFDAAGLTHLLPAAMHAVHAPLRALYALAGPRVLRALSPVISGAAMLDAAQLAAGLGLATAA